MTAPRPVSDFPIPAGIQGFWAWDKMSCPRPQTALAEEIVLNGVSEGFTRGMDEFACPVGFQYRAINTYAYASIKPFELNNESMEDRIARYQRTLNEVLPRMGDLWEHEWLPSILPGLEKARATDYVSLSNQELLDTLDMMRGEFIERWFVHGKINFVLVSASMFADFYNETLKPEDPTEPYQALQGFPTRSLDAGRGLWRLGRIIKDSPRLMKLFKETEPSRMVQLLGRSNEGHSLLTELRAYLDEFGWRSDAFELADPTWREDPTIPLNTLQGYISLDDSADPEVRYQESIQIREGLLAQARARLAGDPGKLAQFNSLYDMARHNLPITENHNYYIDQVGISVMRLPILEIGRRLARDGALADENDVFMLYLSEIREGLAGKDQQALAAQRRADLQKWAMVVPVPAIGEPPPHNDDPLGAAIAKMVGVPPEPSRDPSVITGIGASPGTVQGRAKVVRNLSQASKLEKGDIMVCEMTMPSWTPLFSTVRGLVADTGGVLSHCAIVSREYRLPAVVGTIVGTAVIKDGMMLTVDGSKGIVRIDSRA